MVVIKVLNAAIELVIAMFAAANANATILYSIFSCATLNLVFEVAETFFVLFFILLLVLCCMFFNAAVLCCHCTYDKKIKLIRFGVISYRFLANCYSCYF